MHTYCICVKSYIKGTVSREEYFVCTGAFLYVRYSFLSIYNKLKFTSLEGGMGEQCGKKTLPHWRGRGCGEQLPHCRKNSDGI
jgi:hypothetical protein